MNEIPAQVGELRKLVDTVDDEIIQLLIKRIALSSQLMELKQPLSAIDPAREEAIVQRYFTKLSDASTLPKVKRLVSGIIGASKSYPEVKQPQSIS